MTYTIRQFDFEGQTVPAYEGRDVELRIEGDAVDISIPRPIMLPLPEVDVNSAIWKASLPRFKREQSPYEQALVYAVTGEEAYRLKSIELATKMLDDADADIARQGYPDKAVNHFLDMGRFVEKLSACYAWANPPEPFKLRIADFCDQAIYSIWNPKDMAWSVPRNDTGLKRAEDDNYFLSFVGGTLPWGLASGDPKWINYLRAKFADPIFDLFGIYRRRAFGGSREGTQYGESLRDLARLALLWERGTGESLGLGTWARSNIVYWAQATTPNFTGVCPLGDQTRGFRFDGHHREIIRNSLSLVPSNCAEAEVARWWLGKCGIAPSLQEYTDPQPGAAWPPSSLVHYTPELGHFFARDSWELNATLLYVVAGGPLGQGHSHCEHGNFGIFNAAGAKKPYTDWATVTQNRYQLSGGRGWRAIHQNNLRVENAAGQPILQDRAWKVTQLDWELVDGVLRIEMDLSAAYVDARWGRPLGLLSHHRTIEWHQGENRFVVSDAYTKADPSFKVYQQLQSAKPERLLIITPEKLYPWESWEAIEPGQNMIDPLTKAPMGYRLSLPESTRVEFSVN